jgi:hypothetical protein
VLTLDRAVNRRPAGFVNFVERCDRFATDRAPEISWWQGFQRSTGRLIGAREMLVTQAAAEARHTKRLSLISMDARHRAAARFREASNRIRGDSIHPPMDPI